MAEHAPIEDIVERLSGRYGAPPPPPVTGPFEQVLWETVCYLVDDARRAAAFDALRDRIGLRPDAIARAPLDALEAVACGARPAQRAQRLREVARIALDEHDGELSRVLSMPPAAAKKALMRFPGIGRPGAEKILLFAGAGDRSLPLDSNGLRVLLRLGVATEGKSYHASYRAVQDALGNDPRPSEWLVSAYVLLRRHGKETCRRSAPECGLCPLRSACAYYEARDRPATGL